MNVADFHSYFNLKILPCLPDFLSVEYFKVFFFLLFYFKLICKEQVTTTELRSF
jgi:hypothetical protein